MKLITNIFLWLCSLGIFAVVSVIGFCINFFIYLKRGKLADYFLTLAIGEDQKAGSYLYGTEDWTISSYTYYLAEIKKYKFFNLFMKVIDFIPHLFGHQEHCKRAFLSEIQTNLRNEIYITE